MTTYTKLAALLTLGAAVLAAQLVACRTEDPTFAVVENGYPVLEEGGNPALQTVVYKVWWGVTLFDDPVMPGATGAEQRGVPESAVAFALLAPGWDPASGKPPTTLIPVMSRDFFVVKRGDTLQMRVSDDTFGGNCATRQTLAQEDADFITQRIFPGEFEGVTYDPRTCTSIPLQTGDAGSGD